MNGLYLVRVAVVSGLSLLAAAPHAPAAPIPVAEQLRSAKALFFDGKYAEARQAWEAVRASARGAESTTALYWIARCSEKLGEAERALREYESFLAARPADRTLVEEARTSRVGIAARLYKAGQKQHALILKAALGDSSRTVRYYAALQVASLGEQMARPAVPVLMEIIKTEKDDDLVERAKLALLRVDPAALRHLSDDRPYTASSSASATASASASASASSRARAGWIKVRITEKGASSPKVSVTMPFALAELVFKSLPDEALRELKSEGYDAETFWQKLRDMGPTDVIDIEGDEGERIKIWIE
jgi:tetratricopeptide (TPR) repeat protein